MLKKTNLIIVFAILLFSLSLQAQPEQTSKVDAKASWSKDATDEVTALLIKEADQLLNGVEPLTPHDIAAEALSDREIDSGIQTEPTVPALQSEVTIQEASPAFAASELFQNNFISWIPGLGSILICGTLLVLVKNELKQNRKAALDASQLINDIKDLQYNIKEWELENHYSHISELSEHIDALESAANNAKDERHNIDTSINTSIELNKKSLDILKRANKELSKSLVNQVTELEQHLNQTVEAGIAKINETTEQQCQAFAGQKNELLNEMNSKISAISSKPSSMPSPEITAAAKPQQNWMDIIKSGMNNKSSSSSSSTASTSATQDHASMLRESIERQKAILNQHKSKTIEEKTEKPKSTLSSFLDDLNNKKNQKEDKINKPELKETEIYKSDKSDNNEVLPAEVELEAISTKIENKKEITDEADTKVNKQSEPDEQKLYKKLEHAQKWNNFADAAEICRQIAEIEPAKAEVFDTWGQMLARHAAEIKGNEGTELLKQANKKMHKASMLDSSNYKIFNNWGIILKNLALTYSSTHEAEKTLALARRKFETSISLNPQNHEALSNWGNALVIQARYRSGTLQDSLLQKACEKFEQSIRIKGDKANTLHSWGNALFRLANCKKDPQQRNVILQQAHAKWTQANKIKPGIANKELRVIKSMVPPLGLDSKLNKKSLQHH